MKTHELARNLLGMALIVSAAAAFAQPPDSLWSHRYGGRYWDVCYSVQQTMDEGYILGGGTEIDPFAQPFLDFLLVKTNPNGAQLWNHSYGPCGFDICKSVQQTLDGGYILAGLGNPLYEYGNFLVLKTDTSGQTIWCRGYGGASADECNCVRQTIDGGYILAGTTYSFGAGVWDFWMVKTDVNGNSLWSHTFGGGYEDQCNCVQQTWDGGYILAGWTESFGAGGFDFWLVRTNSNGDSLWSRTFGGTDDDRCYSVEQTSDGGYILGGFTRSFGAGDSDFWLVRTNANGDSVWSRTFGGNSSDECHCLRQTSDGKYALAGWTSSFGAGEYDFWLVKVDTDGDSLWSRTFGGRFREYCYSFEQTWDGGYVLAGSTESFGASDDDFWLVKTGPDLASEQISVSVPAQYALYPNYPNPFNPSTRIAYDLARTSNVTLTAFDLLGRKVATLANGVQVAGSHTATFNGADLPSGIYFYRLQAGDFVAARKMVLLK